MGNVVQLAEIRARKSRASDADSGGSYAPSPQQNAFYTAELGSGWYHSAAIRDSQRPSKRPTDTAAEIAAE
jgi:hypothetical protein